MIGYCINTTLHDPEIMSRTHYRACEVMRFRDMNEVIKCCIYTITLLLYTRIQFTRVMQLKLICDRNSFNNTYTRKRHQNSKEPHPYLTLCEHCSFVVA